MIWNEIGTITAPRKKSPLTAVNKATNRKSNPKIKMLIPLISLFTLFFIITSHYARLRIKGTKIPFPPIFILHLVLHKILILSSKFSRNSEKTLKFKTKYTHQSGSINRHTDLRLGVLVNKTTEENFNPLPPIIHFPLP